MKKIKESLPDTFDSIEEAISVLKLDRRHKWFVFSGELVYDMKFTAPNSCTGCDGGGCRECGGTGKRVSHVPIPAFVSGRPVKIIKK